MRPNHLGAFILGMGLVVAAAGSRGDAQGDHFHVYGAGSLPCARWTADRSAAGEDFRTELSWMLGFVTAFQWNSDGTMADAEVGEIDAFVTQYCSDHPVQNVSDAASALVADLKFRGER